MNVIHSLTLAQMRAKPRRTLTTLAGVALSVAMLTAVFAGADSFLDLMRRQAVDELGAWEGRVTNTSEAVAQAVAQDDRLDQVALAASWGLDPAEDGSFAGTGKPETEIQSVGIKPASRMRLAVIYVIGGFIPVEPFPADRCGKPA